MPDLRACAPPRVPPLPQYTNSGGVSAAALPTPFDQPGGSAAAHHMALHRQQAAQYAGVAGLPQHDAYAVSLAAAAAAQQAGYLQYPPPQVQAPLQIMVTKVRAGGGGCGAGQ